MQNILLGKKLSVRAKHRVFKHLHIPTAFQFDTASEQNENMAYVVINGLFWPLTQFLEARLRINAERVPILPGILRNPFVLENGAILQMDFFAASFDVDVERRSVG